MPYDLASRFEVNYCYPTMLPPTWEYNYHYLWQIQNQAENYNPGNLIYYPRAQEVNFRTAAPEHLEHIHAYQTQAPLKEPAHLPTPNESDYWGTNHDDIQYVPECAPHVDQIGFETIKRTSLKKESNEMCDGEYGAFKRNLDGNLKFFRLEGIEPKGFFLSGNIVMNSRTDRATKK